MRKSWIWKLRKQETAQSKNRSHRKACVPWNRKIKPHSRENITKHNKTQSKKKATTKPPPHNETKKMDINLINSFMEVTNSTRDEAEFFLSASNNDLPTAITNFYNRDSQQQSPLIASSSPHPQQHRPQPQATPTATLAKKPTTTTTRRSGMVTFNDLNRGDDTGGSPDDDQNANRYYAGGSTTRYGGNVFYFYNFFVFVFFPPIFLSWIFR